MNKASTAASIGLSIYAGLLAIIHGIFEFLQGGGEPASLMIQAIGPSCQPDTVWHACLPAMTLLPSYRISGIVVILLGAMMIAWSLIIAGRRYGCMLLFVFSLGLLLAGGGFVPVWVGMLSGFTAWHLRRSAAVKEFGRISRFLAVLWPWTLLVLFAWFLLSWLLGWLLPGVMLSLGIVLFLGMDIVLPLLVAVSAISCDRGKRWKKLLKKL